MRSITKVALISNALRDAEFWHRSLRKPVSGTMRWERLAETTTVYEKSGSVYVRGSGSRGESEV